MFVLMVLVMGVRMFVPHRFMSVLVLMMFGHVEPHTKRHERSRRKKTRAHRLAKHKYGSYGSEERCG
jgi:hypothetical protein